MKRIQVHALRPSAPGYRWETDDEVLLRIIKDPDKCRALVERLTGAVISVVGAEALGREDLIANAFAAGLKDVLERPNPRSVPCKGKRSKPRRKP